MSSSPVQGHGQGWLVLGGSLSAGGGFLSSLVLSYQRAGASSQGWLAGGALGPKRIDQRELCWVLSERGILEISHAAVVVSEEQRLHPRFQNQPMLGKGWNSGFVGSPLHFHPPITTLNKCARPPTSAVGSTCSEINFLFHFPPICSSDVPIFYIS